MISTILIFLYPNFYPIISYFIWSSLKSYPILSCILSFCIHQYPDTYLLYANVYPIISYFIWSSLKSCPILSCILSFCIHWYPDTYPPDYSIRFLAGPARRGVRVLSWCALIPNSKLVCINSSPPGVAIAGPRASARACSSTRRGTSDG